MSRRLQLLSITLVLLIAAALRIVALTRLPPGFNNEEINMILSSATARQGVIASFYNVGDPVGGREGLYPLLQAAVIMVMGDGLLCYRLLSIWCGLVSVALMYRLTRRLLGYFPGIVAAIVMATSLWPILLARSAVREALLLPLFLAMLLVLAHAFHLYRYVESGAPSTVAYALLGILLAALAYTQWSGLLGLPVVAGLLIYLILSHQPISRRILGYSAFSVLIMAILCIPYLAFTVRAFGLSGFHVFWATRPAGLGPMLSSALKTIVAIFYMGDPSPAHNLPGSPLIGPTGGLVLIIGLIIAIRHWRAPNMALALIVLAVGLLPGIWSRDAVDFSRTILALPGLMMLVGVGAEAIRGRIWKPGDHSRDWQQVALATVATIAGVAIVSDGLFNQWATDGTVLSDYHTRLGELAVYLDRTHDDLTTSICTFNLHGNPDGKLLSERISDPTLLDLMTHRRDLDLRFSDCLTGLVLTRGGSVQRFAFADPTARDKIPPIFKDWLKSAQNIPVEGLPEGTMLQLDVTTELADAGGRLILSQVDWAPEATDGAAQSAQLPVRMGGYLTFQGYILPLGTTYKAGNRIDVITYWRADGPRVPPDLRLFIHMLNNPNTEPVIQNDILSVDASSLADRDVFIQIMEVPLPANLPPNTYYLSIGAYRDRDPNKARLPIFDTNNQRGDRLFLAQITVQ